MPHDIATRGMVYIGILMQLNISWQISNRILKRDIFTKDKRMKGERDNALCGALLQHN